MQEHPVPQNVTGYEFHLIGQMTLKQFLEVAAGILIAVIINTTNLPEIIKYPFMIIAGLMGAALAFIPFEGRPLDRWFFAFIKAIYQPTMFFWKKSNPIPEAFEYTVVVQPGQKEIDYKPMRESRVRDYISSLSPTQEPISEEDKQANDILKLFETNAPIPTAPAQTQVLPPQPPQPPVSPTIVVSKQAKDVSIPVNAPVGIKQKEGVTPVTTPNENTNQASQSANFTEVSNTQSIAKESSVQSVSTDTSLPFPNKPTTPNMIVGMVVSKDKKIIENAIITIYKKADRTPVRALKTNTLGQFGVITPLESGEYIISTEKAGLNFGEVSLSLTNAIVDPLFLQANS